MHIDGPGTEVVTSRKGNSHGTDAREESTQYEDRCPHLSNNVEWRLCRKRLGNRDRPRSAVGRTSRPDMLKNLAHQTDVNDIRHVGQNVGARGQQSRDKMLEDRVLCAEHADSSAQGCPTDDSQSFHWVDSTALQVVRRGPDRYPFVLND
ncbi:hypothetical protein BMS3Bbin02_00935 [bacterium BMS3Bbin02]|nr:hypothetical protein BMS3Bbin02_00935 [bacterium BMS3Bbin02]